LDSDSSALELPVSLSTGQRQEVHQLVQHFGLQHTSRGTDTSRFLTLAKPGAIIGEPTLRKLLVSEVVAQGAESHKIVASANVDDVLASAPVATVDTY
jgi:hypothetical protein